MTPRLLICIPVRNRAAIAMECIPTVAAGADGNHDSLTIWDDGSATEESEALKKWWDGSDGFDPENQDRLYSVKESIGIQRQRRIHLHHFLDSDFSHLYMTDADMLHDPAWRSEALRLQQKYHGQPLCLYNTDAHASLRNNTRKDDPSEEVIWRHYAPGCSYLLTHQHVERLRPNIDNLEHFDWQIPALLGYGFATSRTSYCDHIGFGGERHPKGAGLDEGDRALNPTEWLVAKRREVVGKLSLCSQ